MGALGSAWASLITQALMALIQVMLATLFFRFRINASYLMRLMVFLIGVLLINWLASGWEFYWVKSALIVVSASIVLAALLRLLYIENIIRIFKGKEV